VAVRSYLTHVAVEAYRKLLDLNPKAQVSMNELADYLTIQGVVNPRTTQPPTRQGVHYALAHSKEGRKLLEENAKRA
jgi:hypothetical protein